MGIIIKKIPKSSTKPRIIVIVGKAVFKKSTERNLFRRRVKSILSPLSVRLKVDFKVIAEPSAAGMNFSEIKEEILRRATNF